LTLSISLLSSLKNSCAEGVLKNSSLFILKTYTVKLV
jgi:hypothetical protein